MDCTRGPRRTTHHVPLVRPRHGGSAPCPILLLVPVLRLKRGIAVAHLPAAVANLNRGRAPFRRDHSYFRMTGINLMPFSSLPVATHWHHNADCTVSASTDALNSV